MKRNQKNKTNTAYCHASVIDLYLHTKFHWNRRRTFDTGFIRWT